MNRISIAIQVSSPVLYVHYLRILWRAMTWMPSEITRENSCIFTHTILSTKVRAQIRHIMMLWWKLYNKISQWASAELYLPNWILLNRANEKVNTNISQENRMHIALWTNSTGRFGYFFQILHDKLSFWRDVFTNVIHTSLQNWRVHRSKLYV